jgi:hypothetical protein
MIWTRIDSTSFFVFYNFADGVWRAERSLVRIKTEVAQQVFIILSSSLSFTVITNSAGEYLLDVSEYLQTLSLGTSGVITIRAGREITINYTVRGNVAPWNINTPKSGINEIPLVAPSYYLQSLWGISTAFVGYVSPEISGVLRVEESNAIQVAYNDFSAGDIINQEIGSKFSTIVFINKFPVGQNKLHTIKLREIDCRRRYAMVQWVSSIGQIKRHTFEVINLEQSIANDVELQNNYGGFRDLKGLRNSVRLRLEKLNAYDFGYYSDIVTSSDVRVAMTERDADFGEDTRVRVRTDNVIIPNGVNLENFEVDVILKDYDIV